MLALGAELRARGHDVTYETWSRWREHVEGAGMTFVAAPEYPVFPTRSEPLGPYETVVLAAAETQPAIARAAPDVVVHDILTLAPALAAELEGIPVATLIPHVYPVAEPGFPPYAMGARLPRTAIGRVLWRALRSSGRGGPETGTRRAQRGAPPPRPGAGRRAFTAASASELCLVGTLPELEYPRRGPSTCTSSDR